jgi:UDP-glucose:(heptosyl)LPS alpha-1,3-glucosyltransferase
MMAEWMIAESSPGDRNNMHLALNFQRVDPARGGAETYVADLCRSLVGAGHRVDLYAESWADGALPPQVNVVPVAAQGSSRVQRILSFARNSESALGRAHHDCSVGFVNTWAHDVIIPQGGVHRGSLNANARRFPLLLRELYLLGKRANPKHWLHRFIESKQYDRARQPRVVAVSNMVKRHLKEFHRVLPRQIDVVPNAIDAGRVAVSQPGAVRCAFRNRFGLEPGALVGVFVGHNFALKGLKPLLAALAARHQRSRSARPIHLVVCGNGERGPYLRQANRLGLSGTVHFLGFHPDVRASYWSSDFFVQPTYYDPCSLVVLEALACGLPVITTAQNGASELMSDGREGFILTSPDAQSELLRALDRMTDDGARRAMSIQASRLGSAQTFDAHVARLITIFEDVAASTSRSAPHFRRRGSKKSAVRSDQSRKSTR